MPVSGSPIQCKTGFQVVPGTGSGSGPGRNHASHEMFVVCCFPPAVSGSPGFVCKPWLVCSVLGVVEFVFEFSSCPMLGRSRPRFLHTSQGFTLATRRPRDLHFPPPKRLFHRPRRFEAVALGLAGRVETATPPCMCLCGM